MPTGPVQGPQTTQAQPGRCKRLRRGRAARRTLWRNPGRPPCPGQAPGACRTGSWMASWASWRPCTMTRCARTFWVSHLFPHPVRCHIQGPSQAAGITCLRAAQGVAAQQWLRDCMLHVHRIWPVCERGGPSACNSAIHETTSWPDVLKAALQVGMCLR